MVVSEADTAKMNPVDPQAWVTDVLTRIAEHPAPRSTSSCRGTGRGTPPLAAGRPELAAIGAVSTIAHVANMLGENEDWLYDLSIECLRQIIADHRASGNAPPQMKSAK